MKKAILLIAGLFFALSASAQQHNLLVGNGKKIKQSKEVGAFNAIAITGPFEVKLQESSSSEIFMQGSENIVSLIEIKITDGTLSIGLPQDVKLQADKNNRVFISVPYTALNSIYLKGSGSVTSKDVFVNPVNVAVDGSGEIHLKIATPQAKAVVLGTGSIKLSGSAGTLICNVTGSGDIDAYNVKSDITEALVSGSGNINVCCKHALKGRISGSGNIAFAGSPGQQDLKRSGSGDFSMLE
ncbi:head GIN domain-containing protein [Flavobacterium sp.]|uniref:head GIN domain-containing protein n=1 Tax=Flavobacterium sp. TaxID=239 RepID=UPI00260D40A8|nr:head GIN domain-containing protein [Flavobacterium sp.]